MKDVIDENNKNIEKFFVGNIIFILLFIFPLVSSNTLLLKLITSASYVSLFSVFALAFKFSLSSKSKYSLIYFRFDCPFPACNAFEKDNLEDPRIDKNILIERYGVFPIDHIKQNKLWYEILQDNKSSFKVITAYRDFLLLRDCNALSILLACLSLLLYFLVPIFNLNISYSYILFLTLIFVLEFLLFNISAKNAGKRLVKNVLAEECSKYL